MKMALVSMAASGSKVEAAATLTVTRRVAKRVTEGLSQTCPTA